MQTSVVIVLMFIGLNGAEDIVRDEVDLIEINHFFDEYGRLVFDQVIFYDWSDEVNRFQICAWRLLKSPAQIPRRDFSRGDYLATWYDGHLLRKVRSQGFRETWTQYDPELVERQFLEKDKRRELSKKPVRLVTQDERQQGQPKTSSGGNLRSPVARTMRNAPRSSVGARGAASQQSGNGSRVLPPANRDSS
mgnify:FL=1